MYTRHHADAHVYVCTCDEHLLIHIQLEPGSCQYLLLHTLNCAETQHSHLILLPNAMGAVLCLKILTQTRKTGQKRQGLSSSSSYVQANTRTYLILTLSPTFIEYDIAKTFGYCSLELCKCLPTSGAVMDSDWLYTYVYVAMYVTQGQALGCCNTYILPIQNTCQLYHTSLQALDHYTPTAQQHMPRIIYLLVTQ